jgi:hypothetical protein
MLGDLPRAVRDFQDAVRSAPASVEAQHAQQRLHALQARGAHFEEPAEPAPESLWTRIVGLSPEDTIADLVRRAHAEAAFFGMLTRPDGSRALAPIYGKDGLRKHLTAIADAVGPRVLTLRLRQLPDLFDQVGSPSSPSRGEDGAERLVEGRALHLIVHGERVLGVFTDGLDYHYPDLPTVLFGEQPVFGRSEPPGAGRRCASCGREVAYFDAVLAEDELADYACPRCQASPTLAWIEERMRPGGWSRSGFLGEKEVLGDVMGRDAATLERLGLGPAEIAGALDRLLAEAMRASAARIARAAERFEDELRASGRRGVPGLAVLPLGLSLDDLEARLRDGGRIPAQRGVAVGDHDVFLEVHLGYQHCPFTRLRRPWSDDPPRMEVIRRRVKDIVHLTAATDSCLPCGPELSYRHGNLEFLVVHRDTGQSLRGSGLLVHLIRDHRFFEGDESPFRLDPERAARVLGLTSPHGR